MALIQGVGSLIPCPHCLIPEGKQGDPLAVAPLRTTASMMEIIEEARGEQFAYVVEEILQAAGL